MGPLQLRAAGGTQLGRLQVDCYHLAAVLLGTSWRYAEPDTGLFLEH